MLRLGRGNETRYSDIDSDEDNDNNNAVTEGEENNLTRTSTSGRLFSKQRWPARALSALCSALVLSCVAVLVCFAYIILKDLRTERITTEDGSEVRLLGFWSILGVSSVAGVLCCSFSWTLTYFDSFEPGTFPPTPLSSGRFKQTTRQAFHLGYSMAILNGLVATLTLAWYLN